MPQHRWRFAPRKLLKGVAREIRNEKGLAAFAAKPAKFEGWLKVKIITLLKEVRAVPELGCGKGPIDIVCGESLDELALEVKTVKMMSANGTNVSHSRRNIPGVIYDIRKLRRSAGVDACHPLQSRAVLFVVFPYSKDDESWREEVEVELGGRILAKPVVFPLRDKKVDGLVCYGAVAAKKRGTGGR